MASTPVQIQLESGLSSPTLSLYADGSDTLVGGPDTLTEETNRLGLYEATVTEALSGIYYAKAMDGAELKGSGWVTLADDTSEYQVIDNHPGAVAEAVWDAAASSYNVAGSFGKFLRQIKEGQVSAEAEVNDESATTTSFITTLTEASDSHYSDLTVAFIDGALAGQSRIIESYNGTTKTLTFDEAWSEAPADSDQFIILTTHSHTKSQIADAVWDELTADHVISGSTGEALANASSNNGTGARTITVTVDDGTSALENASVRFTEGINTYTATTDASGNATFNLDDATYTIAISKPGYTYAGSSLVVSGDATPTLSMTAFSPTASPAGFTTGYTYVYDEDGVAESSVTVSVYCYEVPTGSGLALDSKVRTGTTNGSGYVEFTNMIQSAKYKIKRGNGPYESFTASTDASFAINNFLGVDE